MTRTLCTTHEAGACYEGCPDSYSADEIADPAMIGPHSHGCTCTAEDVGTGETGPSLSVNIDDSCPQHGRGSEWSTQHGLDYGHIDDYQGGPTPEWPRL